MLIPQRNNNSIFGQTAQKQGAHQLLECTVSSRLDRVRDVLAPLAHEEEVRLVRGEREHDEVRVLAAHAVHAVGRELAL